jgi:hypothetical protein
MNGSGIIAYAKEPIVANTTSALLSVFTEVTNATPTAGARMRPFLINPIVKNEPCYKLNHGSTAGTYSINRNDLFGEIFYNNWDTTGQFSLVDFYNYQHWTNDQRLSIDLRPGGSNPAYGFSIKIAGHGQVMDLTPQSPNPWNSTLDYYGVFPGSVGNFSPGSVNTGWTLDIQLIYDLNSNNQPPFTQQWNIDYYDYHTGDLISNNNYLLGDPAQGPPGVLHIKNFSIYIDYWRCARLEVSFS